MDLLFEVITPYDQETVQRYATYHFRHKGRFWPVAFLLLGLVLSGLALWQFWDGSRALASVLGVIGVGLAGAGVLYLSGKSPAQAPTAPDGGIVVCRTRFFEDRVELSGPQSSSFYHYRQFSSLGEDGFSFYLYIDTGEALVLRKDGFTLGTPEALEGFLRRKLSSASR